MIKLFPALDVVFEMEDEFFETLVMHGRWSVSVGKVKGCGLEKNHGAAPHLSGRDEQTAEVQMHVRERQVRLERLLKGFHGQLPDLEHRGMRKGRRQRGRDKLAASVEREAAARQALGTQLFLSASKRF